MRNHPELAPGPEDEYDGMPHAVTLEYSIIGLVLLHNEVLDSISFLQPAHFFADEHRTIYETMQMLRAEGTPITPYTVSPYLARPEKIEVQYLTKAMMGYIPINNPVSEAAILIDLSERRQLITICEDNLAKIRSRTKTTSEHITDFSSAIESVSIDSARSKFLTSQEVSQNILTSLSKPREPFSTGIAKLDACMDGGMYPGMNYYIAGRKKMGKTTLAGSISYNLNKAKHKHLYIAAEMGIEPIQKRNLSRQTDTPSNSFRTHVGKTPEFADKISNAIIADPGSIIYLNAPGITFEELRRAIAQAQSLHRIKGFIIDSLQLVGGVDARRGRVEHQDEVAQWIADYGLKHGLFSLVTAQVNQTGNIRFGEGCRLSCDMAFEVRAPEDDPSRSGRWLEMLETRYTPWQNLGSAESPGLTVFPHGPFFAEAGGQEEFVL